MYIKHYVPVTGEGKRTVNAVGISDIPCRVCSAPSSGFHFGALTCEGCKVRAAYSKLVF